MNRFHDIYDCLPRIADFGALFEKDPVIAEAF